MAWLGLSNSERAQLCSKYWDTPQAAKLQLITTLASEAGEAITSEQAEVFFDSNCSG